MILKKGTVVEVIVIGGKFVDDPGLKILTRDIVVCDKRQSTIYQDYSWVIYKKYRLRVLNTEIYDS